MGPVRSFTSSQINESQTMIQTQGLDIELDLHIGALHGEKISIADKGHIFCSKLITKIKPTL